MTYKEVNDMIASLRIPYAYYQFPEGTGQQCPFICFYFTGSDDFAADNTNYQRIRPLVIELYTDNKDFDLEETVENLLNSYGLFYYREETFIDSQKMNMVSYETQIVITEALNNG